MFFILVAFVRYTLFPSYYIIYRSSSLLLHLALVITYSIFYTNEQDNRRSKSHDISCGLESLSIPIVFKNKHQISPTKFVYITKSRVHRGFDLTAITELANIDVPGAYLKYNLACKKHVCPCGLGLGHYYHTANGCFNEA